MIKVFFLERYLLLVSLGFLRLDKSKTEIPIPIPRKNWSFTLKKIDVEKSIQWLKLKKKNCDVPTFWERTPPSSPYICGEKKTISWGEKNFSRSLSLPALNYMFVENSSLSKWQGEFKASICHLSCVCGIFFPRVWASIPHVQALSWDPAPWLGYHKNLYVC